MTLKGQRWENAGAGLGIELSLLKPGLWARLHNCPRLLNLNHASTREALSSHCLTDTHFKGAFVGTVLEPGAAGGVISTPSSGFACNKKGLDFSQNQTVT